MNRFFVYLIYNCLLPLLLIAGFPRFLIKGWRRGGLTRNFAQRLGIFRPEIRERLSQPGNVWIHAVSVGEVLIALKLVKRLLAAKPGCRVVLSTTTSTGFALAEKEIAGERVAVIHNPVDLPWVTRSVLRRIRPECLVLVEAEVWPNLVRQANAVGIPVVLVNARLSDRSERRFRACHFFTQPVFSLLSHVGVPFVGDIARWQSLGVAPERITVTGSVKFDEDPASRPEAQVAELREWLRTVCRFPENSRVLLAASTHSGEEALIARSWVELRPKFPGLALVIVPRHAERAREVDADLRSLGLATKMKVPLSSLGGSAASDTIPVAIANTTGELRAWFYLADVVVIGKSLLGHGGQNPVEAIFAGKPVVTGPNMENFRSVVDDLLARDGLIQLSDPAGLPDALSRLLADSAEAADMAQRGLDALTSHRGATERSSDLILRAAGSDTHAL